ncbi:MAG: lysylphosphatidylglycerol synthase transmembrane domain-containing protein [Flavobacteriales bacterium]
MFSKKSIKTWIKLLLTSLAIWFVFRKIDGEAILVELKKVNLPLFLVALIAFLASKTVAAFRQNEFYEAAGGRQVTIFNLKLTAIGMFYNLFLPGSIGGDAYKVYLIKNNKPSLSTRMLISAAFLARLSGVVILFFMMVIFVLFSEFTYLHEQWLYWLLIAALVLCIPVYFIILKFFFKSFSYKFLNTTHLSIWVQIGQVVCSLLLLYSMGINDHQMDYLALFMASSVVAVLPFTIGGIGARELVFIYGAILFPIQEEPAVAFSILFFIITALSSFSGLIFIPSIDKKTNAESDQLSQ